nr:hypothetical protein [Agitococcus sp.]
GWQVELIYLALPNMEMSKVRVAERVAYGGHNIPTQDIERRFARSLRNLLTDFRLAVDGTLCFMNGVDALQLIFEQKGEICTIINEQLYQHMLKEAGL